MSSKKTTDSARTPGDWTRRQLLVTGAAAATLAVPGAGLAHALTARPRTLSFRHLHTGETTEALYWAEGRYLPDALEEINHVLRDFRTGDVEAIDPKLLDLLFALRRKLDSDDALEVVSAYRAPRTNAMLRRRSKGVARNSLHQYGKAIDIVVPGRSLWAVRRAAVSLRAGGVGYYRKSGFVHLDTGRVRYW